MKAIQINRHSKTDLSVKLCGSLKKDDTKPEKSS